MHAKEVILDELRSCVTRGIEPPRRPEPIDLFDALGGDSVGALLVMLEFEAAREIVRREQALAA